MIRFASAVLAAVITFLLGLRLGMGRCDDALVDIVRGDDQLLTMASDLLTNVDASEEAWWQAGASEWLRLEGLRP